MIQTQENGEKPHFWPDFGRLGSSSGREIFILRLMSSVQNQTEKYIKIKTTWKI